MKNQRWPIVLLGVFITIASIFFTAYLKKGRRDRNQNLVSEIIYKEGEVNWIKNSFYGLIFETPNTPINPNDEISDLIFPGVKTAKVNYLETADLVYSVLYMELEADRYDLEKGMEGILNNLVNEMKGTGLKYEFNYGESWLPYGLAEGEFLQNSYSIRFKAFLSFNRDLRWITVTGEVPKIDKNESKNKLRSLVIFGNKSDHNIQLISSSIESIDLKSLKIENSKFKWLSESKGVVLENYNPNDPPQTLETKTPEEKETSKRLYEKWLSYENQESKKDGFEKDLESNSDTSKTKKYDPENARILYNQGNAKSKLKDFRGAIEDFTKSIELYPKSDAYNNRGIAKVKLNDHKGAVADFTKSIELDPTDPDSYSNRGGSRGALGDFKGALEDFTKTIELDPKDGSGYFGSGICKLKLGQKNTGCMDLTNASRLGYPGANEAKTKYCN